MPRRSKHTAVQAQLTLRWQCRYKHIDQLKRKRDMWTWGEKPSHDTMLMENAIKVSVNSADQVKYKTQRNPRVLLHLLLNTPFILQ